MRLLRAFVAHEARTQLRSLRFRVLAAAYLALSIAPLALLYWNREMAESDLRAATYAMVAGWLQPGLTALLSAIVAVDAVIRERAERSLEVVGLAPLTNAGYVLRRWLAVEALVLPLTLLPPLAAAGFATLAGRPPGSAAPFVWPWLLRTAPVSLSASAMGIGLGTLTGGIVLAGFTAFLLFGVLAGLGNDLLARMGRHLSPEREWFGDPGLAIPLVALMRRSWFYRNLGIATEAPPDLGLALELNAIRGALGIGAAALVLGIAPAFLGRTRRDVRPWRIRPDHPLRTFLRGLNRMREERSPDPSPTLADRLLLAVGLIGFLGSAGYLLLRAEEYRELGEERYRAEVAGLPRPTPVGVVPGRWGIAGSVERDGGVRLEVSAVMRNERAEPCARLAFALNPDIEIVSLSADAGSARPAAIWDRVEVTLEPPIPPGGERLLVFELRGVPAEIEYPFYYESFTRSFRGVADTRFAWQARDLSLAFRRRRISARRVFLGPGDLTPVPRYTEWTLTPPSRREGEPGEIVPEERYFPMADLEMDIEAPAGLFLADACGNFTRAGDGPNRLQGGCRLPLTELILVGGNMIPLPDVPGIGAVAVNPRHVEQVRRHIPTLTSAAELARKAWPGLDPFRGRLLLEWPPAFDLDPYMGYRWWSRSEAAIESGRLTLLHEASIAQPFDLDPEPLAISAATTQLAARRPLVFEEQFFFRAFLRAVVRARLGRGRSAVITAQEVDVGQLRQPLLGRPADWEYHPRWRTKLPALVHALEERVGRAGLTEGIEEFLTAGETAGSAEEMFRRLSRRTGVSLVRMYEDFFLGDELPVLTLEGIRFRLAGAEWQVSGTVRNRGTGQAICPVVLRTDLAPSSTVVLVESGGTASFGFRTPYHPRSVVLDPGDTCFRLRRVGLTEREEFREET